VREERAAVAVDLRRPAVADTLMIVLGIGFFVAAVLFTLACDRM